MAMLDQDTTVYLQKLALFSRLLRTKGLCVSTSETADAARLLTLLGLEDRETVRTALRTVFAKTREEQTLFDGVFDGFFISEEAMRRQAAEQQAREQEQAEQQSRASQDLEQVGDLARLSDAQRMAYREMSEEAREKLRSFMERNKLRVERNPQLYSEFIHSVFAKTILEQQLLMENAGENCLAADPELGILYKELSAFQDSEIPKAVSVIQMIARQINGELSASRSHGTRSGKLDFRRTIRRGLGTGGTFQTLCWKKKPARRRRLVLLCDVSGSMVQFSEFALRFLQSLNQVADSSRVFLFSEKLIEADAFQLQNMDSFRDFVRSSGIFGRGTDLGTALAQLLQVRPALLGQGTTLLILSDTKTIDQNRAVQALLEARRASGKIIWMNPIPEGKWQYLRSVQVMQELVSMVSCSTLQELASACRRLSRM